jgi:RimJ/RimL family protein N-acetyltransferase
VLVPSEELAAAAVVLRRSLPSHAEALAGAATASLEHLRPWMPWATEAGVRADAQRERLALLRWEPDSDYDYLMLHPTAGSVIGGCSLMRRRGPGTLEIGYWVHVDHTNRGVATAAAGLLTSSGRHVDGVRQLQIRCDPANVRSAAVPRRLGYRLDRIEDMARDTPASTGRAMVWVLDLGTAGEARAAEG